MQPLLDHNASRGAATAKHLRKVVDKLQNELGFKNGAEVEHMVGVMSINNANLNLREGRGTGTGISSLAARS